MADLAGQPLPSRVVLFVGIAVDFPLGQTYCGQPAFNTGFQQQAREVARRNLSRFASAEYSVISSGSCTSMWRIFSPELFADDPVLGEQAEARAARTYKLAAFLVKVVGVERLGAVFYGKVAYHVQHPKLYGLAASCAAVLQKPFVHQGWLSKLPAPCSGWTTRRDVKAIASQSFRQRWQTTVRYAQPATTATLPREDQAHE